MSLAVVEMIGHSSGRRTISYSVGKFTWWLFHCFYL